VPSATSSSTGAVFVQLQPALIHVVEAGELAGLYHALGRRELAEDDFQEVDLPSPLRPHTPMRWPFFKVEIKPAEQRPPAQRDA